MAFLSFIVEWANEHGKRPSKVYKKYLKNPKDFQLLAAFRNIKIELENEEIKKQTKKHKKPFD